MLLENIYRDINSTLTANNVAQEKIVHQDVIKAINDAIASLRVEYIQNGLGYEFAVTETVFATNQDFEYPFLHTADLEYRLLRSLPIQWTIRQSVFQKTDNELLDEPQSWNAGDHVLKGNTLYQALTDVNNENTFDLTFEVENVRHFRVNNGLKFKEGDVASDGEVFIRFTEDYVNNQDETINEVPAEQLVWRKVGDGFWQGTHVPFDRIYELKLSSSIYSHYPFSVRENVVYTPVEDIPFTISYIPEWQYVEDLTEQLRIPDSMVPAVKDTVIARLARKLSIDIQQEE